MKSRALIALVLVIAVAATWALVRSFQTRDVPPTPTQFVPPKWEAARTSAMHVAHVGKKQVACAECHDRGWNEPAAERACARCHERETERPHKGNVQAATTCTTCHGFVADARPPSCTQCHDAKVAVQATGKLTQHATDRAVCSTCHQTHGGPDTRARSESCTACHAEVRLNHIAVADAGAAVDTNKACGACHAPHQPATAATRCESCHANQRGASRIAQHGACTTCHLPHDPRPGAKASCASCHANVHVLGGTRALAHAQCTSCHDPHRPDVSPADACANCHAAVSPKHPIAANAGPCTTCHDVHPDRADGPRAAACSSCHKNARDERAFHTKNAALTCANCHVPHDFAKASPAPRDFCAGCHAPVATATASKGHAECAQCHGATHAPATKVECGSCHREEVKTAPRGHQTCNGCHATHTGDLGEHAACASCHKNKPAALHGATQGGCASCHRPHGPKGVASPPACVSCHAKQKLPGLHARPSHAKCETCHGGHSAPRAERETCTGTCHVDKRGHQPDAPSCKGCHIFRD